jgi:hypothetical protein
VRQIVLEDLPAPYITPESVAARYRPADAPEPSVDRAPRMRTLSRSVLLRLLADGVITAKQARAGQEIAEVYRAITASVAPRVSAAYGERIGGERDAELPLTLRLALNNRYGPWRSWAGAVAVTPARSLADLTFLVCVDERGLDAAGRLLGVHHTTVKRRLQRSLHWYCANAGWLTEREA